jgi:hypothetical protein
VPNRLAEGITDLCQGLKFRVQTVSLQILLPPHCGANTPLASTQNPTTTPTFTFIVPDISSFCCEYLQYGPLLYLKHCDALSLPLRRQRQGRKWVSPITPRVNLMTDTDVNSCCRRGTDQVRSGFMLTICRQHISTCGYRRARTGRTSPRTC